MDNFSIKNISSEPLVPALEEQLTYLIHTWQKKNDFPVYLLVRQADSDQLVRFKFKKAAWEKLEKGVSHNLLEADIDSKLQAYK